MSNKRKILVVDDDRDFAASIQEWLGANGYEVLVAFDGASGLEAARVHKPALVILDVMMTTDTEGIDVSRKIAESPELQKLPVILLTGLRKAKNLPFGLAPDATWLPVRIVLEKPVAPDVLLNEIQRLVPA